MTQVYLNHVVRKPVFGVSDQVPQKPGCTTKQNMARGLKFRFQEVEGLDYPCSENKGADQLRVCFRICKVPVFS